MSNLILLFIPDDPYANHDEYRSAMQQLTTILMGEDAKIPRIEEAEIQYVIASSLDDLFDNKEKIKELLR